MSYKIFASLNIAIIGNTKVSNILAYGLAKAGHQIIIGLKDEREKFTSLFGDEENISVTTIEDAAQEGDVIIMATEPEDLREYAYLLDDMRRKVIIDTTFMNLNHVKHWKNSLLAMKVITGSKDVVKLLNGAGFENVLNPLEEANAVKFFIAGDSVKAKELVKLLARDMGLSHCYDFGGSSAVRILDEMALYWNNPSIRKPNRAKITVRVPKVER